MEGGYPVLAYFLVAGMGMIIGSFLNVVIHRVPKGESIVAPRSHCPECNYVLGPLDLVPVFSFLLLKGRCRKCSAQISFRYPLVELLTGGVFFLILSQGSGSIEDRLLQMIFVAALISLALIDSDTMLLPDVIVYPLIVLGIIRGFLPGAPEIGESLLSAAGAVGGFGLIALVYPQGMGWGDVKLAAALGTFLGFPHILMGVFFASAFGSIAGVTGILLKKEGMKKQIPFGPYLAAGAFIAMIWGDAIFSWYLTLM